jgi:UDP-glucose 4-epimerase
MKIVVTGGAGFIGSHVVDAFIDAGYQVVVIDDLSTGRASNLNPQAKFYQLDIRSPEVRQVFELERPEVVNHHAAQVDVRRSVEDPLFDSEVNIQAGIRMLQFSVEFGVRKFVYISSGGAVYGEPVYLPCDENHPVHPLAPYGVSKYTLELYLYLYRQNYDLDYTVLRYGNVYGPRQDPHGEAGVVAIFTGGMLDNRQVTINGSGEQERDFVYVSDCARANLLVLERGSGQAYNLAGEMGISINQIYAKLKEITAYQGEAHHSPAKVGETFRIYLSASKARQELDWEPTVDLDQGLRQTVDYFRQAEID